MIMVNRQCKCCGEEDLSQAIKKKLVNNRYKCTNCEKFYWADNEVVQVAKAVSKACGVVSVVGTAGYAAWQFINGDHLEAVQTLSSLITHGYGSDDNPIG